MYEDWCRFFVIPRSFCLRIRNDSDKICTGNQNTHFEFSNFPFKIVQYMK